RRPAHRLHAAGPSSRRCCYRNQQTLGLSWLVFRDNRSCRGALWPPTERAPERRLTTYGSAAGAHHLSAVTSWSLAGPLRPFVTAAIRMSSNQTSCAQAAGRGDRNQDGPLPPQAAAPARQLEARLWQHPPPTPGSPARADLAL